METTSLVSVPALSWMCVLNWMPALQAEFLFLFTYSLMAYLALYFWLCGIFIVAHRLSLGMASEGRSLLQGVGFPLQWLLLCRAHAPAAWAPLAAACRLSGSGASGAVRSSSVVMAQKPLEHVGSEVVEHRLSCPMSCGILLDCVPCIGRGFSTTVPLGKFWAFNISRKASFIF